MKKFAALLLVLAMSLTFGMGAKGCLCKGYDTAISTLQGIINDAKAVIDVINAEFPNTPLPAAEQVVYNAAELAITMANAAMQKACPNESDIAAIQNEMSQASEKATALGLEKEASPELLTKMLYLKSKYGLK